MQYQTTLSLFLKELEVKFTTSFTDKYFMEHPYKYTLYGLSRMLNDYGVVNTGIRVDNKDLSNLQVPFIAHAGGEFVIVKEISDNNVMYLWKGKLIHSHIEEFRKLWSGATLIAESDEQSIEPDYAKHQKESFIHDLQKNTIYFLLLLGFLLGVFHHNIWSSWGYSLNLLLNGIGIYISYLLLNKQMKIKSNYADKICSLFHQKDCNNVLESDAAKFMGIFSWSEIGLGYFISNIILLLFFPHLAGYYAIINACSLPYTVWSIWYQYKVAKQWCVLCVIVQVLLWIIWGINLIWGQYIDLEITAFSLLTVLIIYSLPILILNKVVANLGHSRRLSTITWELNSLKNNTDVFLAQLKKQKYYPIDKSVSQIVFGNPNASLRVSILTNPHCAPCAGMHKRVEKIVDKLENKIAVQYVFSAFNNSLLNSNKFLIGIYLNKTTNQVKSIYSEWFAIGKKNAKSYFKKFDIDFESLDIMKEFENHENWKKEAQLMATPTILVNGYKLPENYKIEDLIYFTDIEIN